YTVQRHVPPRALHSFPTRRSSDLGNIVAEIARLNLIRRNNPALQTHLGFKPYNVWNDNILYFGKHTEDLSNFVLVAISLDPFHADRKSTRLNSSHVKISYAVFCLK